MSESVGRTLPCGVPASTSSSSSVSLLTDHTERTVLLTSPYKPYTARSTPDRGQGKKRRESRTPSAPGCSAVIISAPVFPGPDRCLESGLRGVPCVPLEDRLPISAGV